MTITYGFYNSLNGDRKYDAVQMSAIFNGLITDGIFENFESALVVSPGSGMNVSIAPGRAWFNTTWTNNDAALIIPIDSSDLVLNRIDTIVLEVNSGIAVRANSIKCVKGTLGASPSAPSLTNTEFVHQYPLAHVSVPAGITQILSGHLTDKRGSADCPYVTGVLQTISLEDIALLMIDEIPLILSGGNLATDGGTGFCDYGEPIKSPINSNLFKVNRFEKGEIGVAELAYVPKPWNKGTVTAKLKFMDVGGNVINNCDTAWSPGQGANTVCTADTSVKLEGTASAKCAVALGATTGALQYASISQDLRGAKYFSCWVRVSVSVNAGDLYLFIYQPTPGYKSYSLPAIAANTWTKVSIAAGDVSAYSLATQFGIGMTVDKGAFDIYIDQACWQGDVTWLLGGYASTPGDEIDLVPVFTEQEITGTSIFFKETEVTFPTITIGQTPINGDKLVFHITRKNNASDTHGAGKICFTGAQIILNRG